MKHQNVANIGDLIKAFDFDKSHDQESFLSGIVIDKGQIYFELEYPNEIRKVLMGEGYAVKIIGGDSDSDYRKGDIAFVPFEKNSDYDERVSLIATEAEVEMVLADYRKETFH